MNEAGRSKQSETLVKKKSSSGRLLTKKKVANTVGGPRGFSDSSSRNLSGSSKEKKRRRVVESDSVSSDYSSETTRQKFHKPSAVYEGGYLGTKEIETVKRASSGLDVFEFDEYDGVDDNHRWNSYRQMESGNGASRPTYDARTTSQLDMEDDDFDLPLSVLSKKHRSSSNQPIKQQGKNGVLKVMVNKNKQMGVSHRSYDKKEAEDQKESKPRVAHKKMLDKNGDHRDGQSEDTKSKEKDGLKSVKPMVEKSSKEINEIDTLMESNSNSRVEAVKKTEKVKKVKENESTEKQILRKEIKNMLVDAGWTIGYRPRRNKDYLDAIYTDPCGTVYWSIIKAYESLRKEDSGNFTPLPVEILGKLARQTQKKTERELNTNRKDERITRNAKEHTVSDHEDEMNSHGKTTRRLRSGTLLVRDSNKVLSLENDGFSPCSGKRTILAWLIDSGVVRMSEHVEYMNNRRTRVLLKGQITRDGIYCGCCSKILTVLEFEQHSGSKLCNPFPNMFLESGKSLMQCQIDSWNELGELEQKGYYNVDVDDDPNDDTCGVCGDGGDLMCCDGCPSTFHQSCLEIEMLPEGDWLCPNCSCKYCEMADGNCTKEGGKIEASLFKCRVCYKKYHESCRPGIDVKRHESNSLDLSFCGHKCHEVYIRLQKVVGVNHELDSGFSWSLIHRSDSLTDGEVSQMMGVECNSMLAVAMSVMDECFLPFTDRRSGINLIRNVVFNCGSNLDRLDYSGFYTAILERGGEVVSAASIRFHGTQLAEMPFIGTRHVYRRQGMCRRLLSAIESALSTLQVDKLIIPAVAELMNTWTDVFGFQPLEESHKQELKSMNLLVFPGTDMLQKPPVKQATSNVIPEGINTVEADGGSALSKRPELVSFNVAEFSDKNATEYGAPTNDRYSLDASKEKETLLINPPDKDESPCEPERQLPGKESDFIHSHSDSKVDEIAVQNGGGTNSKEGSCGSERSRKDKERGIPVAVSDTEATNDLSGLHSCNNTAEVDECSSLSKNMELSSSNVVELSDKTAIPNSCSQELGVPLDASKETHLIDSPVKAESCRQVELQLPGKESDSIHSPSDSKGNNTIELDDHSTVSSDLIILVKDEMSVPVSANKWNSFSGELDRNSGNNPNGKTADARFNVNVEESTLQGEPKLQHLGKECDSISIHSHPDSKVEEITQQNGNGTNHIEASHASEMN